MLLLYRLSSAMANSYTDKEIENEIIKILSVLKEDLSHANCLNYHIAIRSFLTNTAKHQVLNILFQISTQSKRDRVRIKYIIRKQTKESNLSYNVVINSDKSRIKNIVLALNDKPPLEICDKLADYFLTEQLDGTFIIFEDRGEITSMMKSSNSIIYGIPL